MSNQVFVSNMKQAGELGFAVYNHKDEQWVFPFVLVTDEKRVRLDVFDSLSNYEVYTLDMENDKSYLAADWTKNLT